MKYTLSCCGLLLAIGAGAGCIQSHHAPAAVSPGVVYYTPAAEPVPPPTSDRSEPPPVVHVAPDAGVAEVNPPNGPPPAASSQDIALAESISRLLKGDAHMASISQNVQTTIENGVLTLEGAVPSESARDEIGMRMRKLPGVAHVYNRLAVNNR